MAVLSSVCLPACPKGRLLYLGAEWRQEEGKLLRAERESEILSLEMCVFVGISNCGIHTAVSLYLCLTKTVFISLSEKEESGEQRGIAF